MTTENATMIAKEISRLADAVTPNVCGCNDGYGNHVESLTEAVLSGAKALNRIADALSSISEAIREHCEV